MKILFALPGLHRYDRGAEIAFISVASELAKGGDTVTLIGSGQEKADVQYRFLRAASASRKKLERLPKMPMLRNEFAYEELSFVPALLAAYRPADYDVTVTCSYPFTNWALRRPVWSGSRPPHVFVTQNGDWPAYSNDAEFRFFGCEGLICTNPDFYDRNKDRWRCRVIPNGVDCSRFMPGPAQREQFGLPANRPIILMVSALSPSKRVEVGIDAVSRIPNAHLVVAGDGPLRQAVDELAARQLPGRFTRLTLTPQQMPALYRAANVFLHLSMDESFGNVFVEALACGLPVVGHDSPRSRWIVGDREYLVDTNDPANITRNLELALAAPPVEQQARVERATRFSWAAIGRQYRDFLAEIVERSRSSSNSGVN
ncbi:Glycosyl transferase, group 1 [Bradyrhizobium sp. STM 3843]|uniref:glycosyltransferase family 4 protein n=1 Tax=Bradyrhizobium sp. STM 3843 TaxID=551947 RepID=UPI0002405342|nr:glycosyltransferase family 4 protein [Bradyrhizobium sp. STM 3843]CCE09382.1 Glycosyl transferase, group 1 [Bradyrhizobium sp. STM 3843]